MNRRAADNANRTDHHPRQRRYRGSRLKPRGIQITAGCIKDLIPLAHLHYLKHLPAIARQVWRALDTETGNCVAVCCTGWPTLRSGPRERTFGRWSPTTINRRITQLQRLIVHPALDHQSIATRLLRHAIKHSPTPILEATNRSTVPPALFLRCGMKQVKDGPRNYYYIVRPT